jgi:hypothetical protein
MGMELYYEVGIIISWNHTIGIIPRRWNHCKEMESYHGIIPWPWNHTMESFQGHGIIIPWNHSKIIPWNHTMGSYQESYHGIIPWDHTMGSYQRDGIIPWNYTKTESYHTIHRDFLTTFISQNKSIQNNNM